MLSLAGIAAAWLSALLLFLAAPQARVVWRGLRRRALRSGSAICAVIALVCTTAALGIGAGFCLALGAWMTGAIALPYLALLRPAPAAAEDA